MGGNARGTNKVTGEVTLAQKIPLKKVGRAQFIKKFHQIFLEIDKRFQAKYGKPLWANKGILKNGVVFNGSTSFIMNPEIADSEVVPFKETVGDIDIMVPEEVKEDLWHLLDGFESSPEIMPGVQYKGSNKLTLKALGEGEQINSVFEVQFGDTVTWSQVDFEFTRFSGSGDNQEPDEFSRFGHSSNLSDAQNGFKGVSHKYILRALAGGASFRDNVMILTPSATYEKPKFRKTKGETITNLRMSKFHVASGIRRAYEKQFIPGTKKPWVIDGKQVYRELKTSDSTYETSIKTMYKMLFGAADDGDLDKMWSFVGIVDLMKRRLKGRSIPDTFERFLDLQWGYGAQRLERDSPDVDFEIKAKAVNYMISQIPGLKKYDKKIKEMTARFYANYDKAKMTEDEMVTTGAPFRDMLLNS